MVRIARSGVALLLLGAWPLVADAQETVDQTTRRTPRVVAPQLIAPPDVETGNLQRVEPRPPLNGKLGQPPVRAEMPRRDKLLKPDPLLFSPVAKSAGVIVAGGRTITISGVEPVPEDQVCGGSVGLPWPCGKVARTAFRGFLRGRAVRCDFPEGEVPAEVAAPCRMGNRDLGEWLVANGWARPIGDMYREQLKTAVDGRKGMHGDAPPSLPAGLKDEPPSVESPLPPLSSARISILPTQSEDTPDQPAVEEPVPLSPQATAPADPLPAPSSPLPPPAD